MIRPRMSAGAAGWPGIRFSTSRDSTAAMIARRARRSGRPRRIRDGSSARTATGSPRGRPVSGIERDGGQRLGVGLAVVVQAVVAVRPRPARPGRRRPRTGTRGCAARRTRRRPGCSGPGPRRRPGPGGSPRRSPARRRRPARRSGRGGRAGRGSRTGSAWCSSEVSRSEDVIQACRGRPGRGHGFVAGLGHPGRRFGCRGWREQGQRGRGRAGDLDEGGGAAVDVARLPDGQAADRCPGRRSRRAAPGWCPHPPTCCR